jgi:hypothetical protein
MKSFLFSLLVEVLEVAEDLDCGFGHLNLE